MTRSDDLMHNESGEEACFPIHLRALANEEAESERS